MATKLVKVPVEGIKAEEVLALWHTGKLYVKLPPKNVPLEKIKDNVRAYVDRLRPFVTAAFRDSIDELWDEIHIREPRSVYDNDPILKETTPCPLP